MALWMETGSEPKTQTESADLDAITALKESAALELKEKEEEEDGSCDYKLVPWLSWDQWNFVRKSLFSSSPENIATALRRISAWRSRGCLPITVEVTAAIIEVQQRDPFFREGSTNDALDSEEMLAMLYCMAIMRLVNGVVEKTRKKTEVSIGEAADAIGIPRMLIDIRHEGSHRDLPSLQLVRFASTKALDWLRSYYWEPQKNAIPFQRGGTSTVRKEIKSRLCELVYYLNIRQSQHSDPSLIKGRGVKRSEPLCGGTKFFSHMAGKLRSSKSGSRKKQITKNLRNLVRLYSLFPSEVVFVLMEFILKAYDSSYGHVIESSDNSQGGDLPGNSKISMGKIDDWKLVITQLSSKEPELLLTMLKAVLEMIETQEAMKSKIGHNLSSSDYKADICQIEHLFSLVPWLIEKLKEVKHPERRGSATEIQVSTSETDVVPKATLTELIRKCLLVVAPGTNQLTVSALLLAQMIGNSFLVERLKKISMLSFTDFECINESSTCLDLERILLQQEDSIAQAAEKLEFLKLQWMKDKMVNTEPSIVDTQMKKNTWTIAKSWNPCPIGMLPRALGSSGTLPILDRAVDCLKVQDFSERKENWELNQCSGKREACCDVELLENSSVTKKMRETVDGDGLDGQDDLTLGASRGRLMIDGSWRKVGEEELLAIESAIRILL